MSDKIPSDNFSGHRGFVVRDSGAAGEAGVLDPTDEVRRLTHDGGTKGRVDSGDQLGAPVAWNDADFADARRDYTEKRAKVTAGESRLSDFNRALAPRTPADRRLPEPNKKDLRAVADSVRPSLADSNSPGLRSDASLVQAGALGVEAQQAWLWNKVEPGKQAFAALQRALRENPDSVVAWQGYGIAMTAVLNSSFRGMAEDSLGIKLTDEVRRLTDNLARFPDDVQAQTVLYVMLETVAKDGDLTEAWRNDRNVDANALRSQMDGLRSTLRRRLPELMRRDPAGAAKAREATREACEAKRIELPAAGNS